MENNLLNALSLNIEDKLKRGKEMGLVNRSMNKAIFIKDFLKMDSFKENAK